MAFAVLFNPVSMSAEQYAEIQRRLDAAGHGNPAGRLHHVCFGEDDALRALDVWTSLEEFYAFGGALMPILAAVGVDPGEPEVLPVERLISAG